MKQLLTWMSRLLLLALLSSTFCSTRAIAALESPKDLKVEPPENDSGLMLELSWSLSRNDPTLQDSQSDFIVGSGAPEETLAGYAILRAESPEGPFRVIESALPIGTNEFEDLVTSDATKSPPLETYFYRVGALRESSRELIRAFSEAETAVALASGKLESGKGSEVEVNKARASLERVRTAFIAALVSTPTEAGHPHGSLFHSQRLGLLIIIFLFAGLMFYYTGAMRRGRQFFIRRIAGIDAIEEAIGRSTEMGLPVLYVPGTNELQDIQTIASMLILGRIAEIVGTYESDMVVSCSYPMVREVAAEVIRAGYYAAGWPDGFDSKNVRFISSEQFAFCAGTNGIILREKPAANIYLGCFFAESLIFAETGLVNKSIQIAGTAELAQLPFFVVSCDYTIIGEELYAVSAYLAQDPRLISSLRASDIIKILIIVTIVVGTIMASYGNMSVIDLWTPGSN